MPLAEAVLFCSAELQLQKCDSLHMLQGQLYTQERMDTAASYHPVGTYEFIQGSKLQSVPAHVDSANLIGSTATEEAIAKRLTLFNTLLRTADGGWYALRCSLQCPHECLLCMQEYWCAGQMKSLPDEVLA